MRWAWVLVVLAAAAGARGQEPGLAEELAGAERRAADRGLLIKEREAAADKALELRRKLIAGLPAGDARLTGLLLDQAAGVLAALARDGSDTAAMFGIPLPAQRERVLAASHEAVSLLDRAAGLTEDAAKALAAQGVPAEDPRARALEQDRGVRIPFFRARAGVLLAACGPDREKWAGAAAEAVGKLALASTGPEAARRVNFGAALLMRKQPPEAGDAQAAAEEFTWVVKQTGPEGAVSMVRAEAWLGLVQAGIAQGRIEPAMEALKLELAQDPFAVGGRVDTLLSVLAADAATRALFERGARTGSAELLERAVAQQTALVARTDLSVRGESLRPLMFEKLAALAAGVDPKTPLPAGVRLAKAIMLAREPGKREEAMRALQGVADTPGAGAFGGDALWELAVLLTGASDEDMAAKVKTAGVLTRLAQEYPEHPRAAEAMGAALAYARPVALEGKERGAVEAYAAALEVATESYPSLPDMDLWRYERARLLVRPPGGGEPAEGGLWKALDLIEGIPAGSARTGDADRLMEMAAAELIGKLRARADALRAAGDEGGVKALSREKLVPAARRAASWAQARKGGSLERLRLDLADALTDAGDGSGRAIYESLLPREGALGVARVRLGLGRALVLEGKRAEGFAQLRDLAVRLDGVEGPRPREFWFAWTLMLEMLSEENKDGTRSGGMRANLKRLEAIDAGLGGEPWRARIVRVREGLGG